jgi:hypothetical protein
MKAIRETIGSTTMLIQTMDGDVEIVGETQGGRSTQLTGIEDQLEVAYTNVRSAIKDIAEDIGAELENIRASARPKQVEMEFNMGISAQAGPVWILSGKGEYGLKVKMTWELKADERTG